MSRKAGRRIVQKRSNYLRCQGQFKAALKDLPCVCRDRGFRGRRRSFGSDSDDGFGGYVPRKRQEAPQAGHANALHA